MLPPAIAMTIGLVAWLVPATLRLYARGGDPDLDFVLPEPRDAVIFVVVSAFVAAGVAGWLGLSVAGFAGLVAACTLVVVRTGGGRVAELWGRILGSSLEALGG